MINADIHCHPILKCYGKNEHQPSINADNEANLFHHKKFSFWNRLVENILTLTPYRQSDLFSAQEGEMFLLGQSVYSPERDFFVGKLDFPGVENWVTDFGKDWIKEIQDEKTSYYDGLKKQFEFIEALDQKATQIKGKAYKYQLIKSSSDLQKFIDTPEERTILLFHNIEGGHNLFHHLNTQQETDEKIVEGSISYIKSKSPFYFTLAHHFYNQLSGHCISLPPVLENLRPQEYGSKLGLRPQGRMLIKELLSRTNGPRVLIDIKHMNPRARNEYYSILEEYKSNGDQIPILFSHGGANGIDSFENKIIKNTDLHNQEIGLYDDEIIKLVESSGLFGLNLDERVMSSDKALKKTKKYICSKRRFKATSGLIWNNIEQVVSVTATKKINPWYSLSIGSDFDGIINPVNGFWTLEYMPRLRKYLGRHLNSFLKQNPDLAYGMSQVEILDHLFSQNAVQFLLKHFRK